MDPFLLVTLGSLQPGLWIKVQTAPVLVQNRCRIGRRLIFSELCASTTGLGPFYTSRDKFIWKLISLGRVSHFSCMDSSAHGCQGVPLGASLPGNLPLYSWGTFRVLEPWKGLTSSKVCGLSNLGSPRIGEGLILGPEGSPALFHCSLHASFSPEKFSFEFREKFSIFGTQVCLVGGPYSSVEDVLRSPSLPGIYLPWDLEQVWTNLMISTSVGSFFF